MFCCDCYETTHGNVSILFNSLYSIYFEDKIEDVFEKMKLKYTELVGIAKEQGWQARPRPVKTGKINQNASVGILVCADCHSKEL